eukprot:CAMPEP_0194529372 /NCGR_PEP_ID=MMETSP0253-20130528/66037_1 /TAXON_ID=2966 /ORGANISM="Noctiluca scintillans" /LENGTH=60 /DNA_ID=CAMNT_0039374509 /DNA_START=146 /DNA_END=325 /DNA_ORIENTATION=+
MPRFGGSASVLPQTSQPSTPNGALTARPAVDSIRAWPGIDSRSPISVEPPTSSPAEVVVT